MAGFAQDGDTVLEPACGPAIQADFLPKGVVYYGFDTNEEFINYAHKKNLHVSLGNVLDSKNYFPADVIIACDIFHHLNPNDRNKFIRNCFLSVRKVFIICEPGKANKPRHDVLNSFKNRLAEWSEKDGTDDFIVEHFSTRKELLSQIESGFNVIPSSYKRITKDFGEDIIAVFFKDELLFQKSKSNKNVSAIVPVFNEEKTIAGVIESLLNNHLINEVICVNDGSTDKSLKILNKYRNRIKLINLKKNKGKGYALARGIGEAKGEIVIFIDADLTNLSSGHIENILEPILEGGSRAVLGFPSNGWMPDIFQNLTGERVYYKIDLIPHLQQMASTRFGVEVFLNNLFSDKQTTKIPLKQLKGLYKYEKHGSLTGYKELLVEGVEIAKEIGKREGLLPFDKQIIDKLADITSFNELKKNIESLKNKHIKVFFEKYILRYIRSNV